MSRMGINMADTQRSLALPLCVKYLITVTGQQFYFFYSLVSHGGKYSISAVLIGFGTGRGLSCTK